MSKKIFLVDGTGLIFRGYYSLIHRPMYTSKGKNTSAIFGFMKMFIKMLKDYKPDVVIFAYDVSRKTFRTEIYPEYKANRDDTPEELKPQIGDIIELTKMMGLPVYAQKGYEADDIIGTLSVQLKADNHITILTGDKDLFQLVDDKVRVLAMVKGLSEVRYLNRDGVKELKGVYPEQIPDYLALVGDSSDNIPGVRGIGPKGATTLLNLYEDLDDIYLHIEEIKGATQKKLREYRDNAYISKELAIIKLDVPIENTPDLENVGFVSIFNSDVINRLQSFEMGSITKQVKAISGNIGADGAMVSSTNFAPTFGDGLFGSVPVDTNSLISMDGSYTLVHTVEALGALIAKIKLQGWMSVDFETTSKQAISCDLIGIAVSLAEKSGYYIPLMHSDVKCDFSGDEVIKAFTPIFEDESIKKIGQNLKYETEVLLNFGIILRGIEFDTMIAAYLIDSSRSHYNLDNLAESYLNYRTVHYKELVKDDKLQTLLDVDIDKVRDYACEDADITLRLKNKLDDGIDKLKLNNVFHNIELPLVPILADMEHSGILIDVDYLHDISKRLIVEIERLKKSIYELAGDEFNINSTKQLREILFEKLKLNVVKYTPTKKPSTDEQSLKYLSSEHDLPKHLLEYRTYTKLKNTYVDVLPTLVNKKTGRIHTSFNQTVTATGRLSSSNPNLQNIPIRDKIGRDIRKAFISKEGFTLISVDYSQIELRLFAHLSGDEKMIAAFEDGVDIHSQTASLILGVSVADVTKDQRSIAKTINYGISYGMGPFRLSHELGITMADAKKFIENYFDSFPKMRDFMQATIETACQNGEVRTLYGRRRPVKELIGRQFKGLNSLNHAERFSINTVVQGTAADIMKLAMIDVFKDLSNRFPATKMLLQIHDELVFETPDDTVDEFCDFLRDKMEHTVKLNVPLTVDVSYGKKWEKGD